MPDWLIDGLHCLSDISLGKNQMRHPPRRIILPLKVKQVRDLIWGYTEELKPRREWMASFVVHNDQVNCYIESGRTSSVDMLYIRPNQQIKVGFALCMHTHPGKSAPSTADLSAVVSTRTDYQHPTAHVVVAGDTTYLLLRDSRGDYPVGHRYISTNGQIFNRLTTSS